MSTILIFDLKQENLIKVVYTQGNSAKQDLEKYPDHYITTKGGQVHIINKQQNDNEPTLTVPTSRTIIKIIRS